MSWIHKLYETYENCSAEAGIVRGPDSPVLLPIAHSTQNAQIEVVVNGEGRFIRARLIDKQEAVTVIPVTEDSAARGNGIAPHPLCDKLIYVAGDYSNYVEKKKSEEYFDAYINKLEDWCNSQYANKKVQSLFKYLSEKTLISDLINVRLLECDNTGKLSSKVKLGQIAQTDAFVRFRVEADYEPESAVWLDSKIYESFISYYLNKQGGLDLCYASGTNMPCSEKHPSKIRNSADKSKLISANDDRGFTYRGRFAEKNQVVSVGYEVSQKVHCALRWLVSKQGYQNGEQTIVAWGTNNQTLPELLEDTQSSLFGYSEESIPATEEEFSKRLNNAIAGYGCDLDTKAQVAVIALEAATTGRLSITYYRELNGEDFLDRIKLWHSSCSWKHTYKKIPDGVDGKGKERSKYITFVGAPSPKDIAYAAYGSTINDKLKKATVERLLPCIIDSARLPYDLVSSVANRASNPVSMEKFEWEKVLSIACALIKKYEYDRTKEVWKMSLDESQKDRSYLFGRLLAVAEQIERYALELSGEKRDTNAERLMHQFKLYPYRTWGILTDKLRPYICRLGSKGKNLVELMTGINSLIPYEEFISSEKLKDSYILGYYCQRQVFIDERNRRKEEKDRKKIELNE
ncbi:MAG: type I-C CRISPR-associated protein Cas8c/Csd1 [Bacillota bacterium]